MEQLLHSLREESKPQRWLSDSAFALHEGDGGSIPDPSTEVVRTSSDNSTAETLGNRYESDDHYKGFADVIVGLERLRILTAQWS